VCVSVIAEPQSSIEPASEAGDQAGGPIGRAEKPASVVGPALEGGDHPPFLDDFIPEQIAATLCRHPGGFAAPSPKDIGDLQPRCT
jgi:hypothetical protein